MTAEMKAPGRCSGAGAGEAAVEEVSKRDSFMIGASVQRYVAQPCTCRAAGTCLVCRRWAKAIERVESHRGA